VGEARTTAADRAGARRAGAGEHRVAAEYHLDPPPNDDHGPGRDRPLYARASDRVNDHVDDPAVHIDDDQGHPAAHHGLHHEAVAPNLSGESYPSARRCVDMDIHIREQRLPGIGHRYELNVDGGRKLTVVVQHGGRREVGLVSPLVEEPDAVVSLSEEQAVALAALLSGARFSIDSTTDDHIDCDEVVVETVTLGPGSPAVGRPANDIHLMGGTDAAVLAVIRDETPELVVEDETTRPSQPGDRVVIAVRREHLATVVRQLAG
jgi:TrkA domain protein